MTARIEDVVLAGCLAVVALSMTVLWLLAKPTSRLSRWLDGEIAGAFDIEPT